MVFQGDPWTTGKGGGIDSLGINELQAARDRYKSFLQKAIRQQGPLYQSRSFERGIDFGGNPRSQIANASVYGAVNQPAISAASKAQSDAVASHRFMYPSTDILAYHRRIEQPEVFSHSPTFGF